MSILTWLCTLYISLGLLIMMEAIVESWKWEEFPMWVRIVGSILSIALWPAIFFMN